MRDLALHVAATGSRRDVRDHAALGRGRASVSRRGARARAHARRSRVPARATHAAAAASLRARRCQAPVAPRLRVRHRPHGLVPVLPAPRGERDRASPQVRAGRELARDLDEGLLAALRGRRPSARSDGSCSRACVLLPHTAYCFSRLHAERLARSRLLGSAGAPAGPLRRARRAELDGRRRPAARRLRRTPRAGEARRPSRARVRPGTRSATRTSVSSSTATAPSGAPLESSTHDARARLAAVRLHGRRPEDEVDEAIARAACLVTASEREGYGLVVVEAAAQRHAERRRRRPENAATELVEDGVNGVVSPDASPESLARRDRARRRGGLGLRESTARWFAENAPTLRIDRSLELVAESYAACSEVRSSNDGDRIVPRTTIVPPRSASTFGVHAGRRTT